MTPEQSNLLGDLLIDCNFIERAQRNAYLSRVTKREIKFMDDLTVAEASLLICQLIRRKNRERDARRMDGEKGLFDE